MSMIGKMKAKRVIYIDKGIIGEYIINYVGYYIP